MRLGYEDTVIIVSKTSQGRFDHCQLKDTAKIAEITPRGLGYEHPQLAKINHALNPAKRTTCDTFLAIFHLSESITNFHNNSGQISRNHAAG